MTGGSIQLLCRHARLQYAYHGMLLTAESGAAAVGDPLLASHVLSASSHAMTM